MRSAEYLSHPPECADWRGLDQCVSHGRLLLTPTALAIGQNGSRSVRGCGTSHLCVQYITQESEAGLRELLPTDIQGRAHIHPPASHWNANCAQARTHAVRARTHAGHIHPTRLDQACSDSCKRSVQQSNTTQPMLFVI